MRTRIIMLEKMSLKIERLQNITDDDCLREGVVQVDENSYEIPNHKGCWVTAQHAYAYLVDFRHGVGTWDSNPYVLVYESN